MKHCLYIVAILLLGAGCCLAELSDQALKQVGFEQKPGALISPGIRFRDETGRDVRISDYLGRKPVILVPAYYHCPMLCTLVQNGLIETLRDLRASVGADIEVVDFSIDPTEPPSLAARKKETCIRTYGRPGSEKGWHFLTGDEASITQLCSEIGFHYAYDPAIKQYAHPSGFVVLTPGGRIVRYFFGVDYPARELDAAVNEASRDRVESPVRQLLLLCFHYNPIRSKYGALIINVVRGCGVATMLALGLFVCRAAGARKLKP